MTSALPVAALPASASEALGVLGYLVATALVLRLAVRWARDAVRPPAVPVAPDRPLEHGGR